MLQTYKLTIAYDGTDYCGWQRQKDKKTIQGQIEAALLKIFDKSIPVIGSGRTDSGVHAQGQVAHIKTEIRYDDQEFIHALNGNLARDIRVLSLHKVSPEFHARKSARSKIYRYRIFNIPEIDPFVIRYVHHWPAPLDIDRMTEASSYFVGEHDFSSFSSNRFLNPIRTVSRSEIKRQGSEIIYTVQANGFLRYMVRTMVGTLLEIGKGAYPPQIIQEIFPRKARAKDTPTAPAAGLCLIQVNY